MSEIKGFYFTGDGARRDKDGYFWIVGRIDDVLNVARHRLGTSEIESALVSHAGVAGLKEIAGGGAVTVDVTTLEDSFLLVLFSKWQVLVRQHPIA